MSTQRQRMSWNLKGRSAVAALDPSTRHRITQSHAMASCFNKPLLATLEELIQASHIAGLVGPLRKPDRFLCLITRLLQITPDPSIVMAALEQDVHKYLRVAALIVIRLIGNAAMVREALRIGWEDYRKIRVYGSSVDWEDPGRSVDPVQEVRGDEDAGQAMAPSYIIRTVDEITDRLFNITKNGIDTEGSGNVWLGVHFSPLIL